MIRCVHLNLCRWLMAAAAVPALACATTAVRTDYDRQADFGHYETYAIRSGSLVEEDDVAAVPDTIVRDRIHGALEREFEAMGFEPSGQRRPDIIVTYAVTAQREPELVQTVGDDPNWNYGGHNVFPRDVDRGTLVIDVIDANDGKLVWRSIAKAEDEDVRSDDFIRRAVDKAMSKFPPGVSS